MATKDGGADAEENTVRLCPNHHRLFDKGKIASETVLSLQAKRAGGIWV